MGLDQAFLKRPLHESVAKETAKASNN